MMPRSSRHDDSPDWYLIFITGQGCFFQGQFHVVLMERMSRITKIAHRNIAEIEVVHGYLKSHSVAYATRACWNCLHGESMNSLSNRQVIVASIVDCGIMGKVLRLFLWVWGLSDDVCPSKSVHAH
jgi:hypothetical protein